MLDKPGIEDEKIVACLKASYGLSVTELEFLQLGYDSAAGVYRVRAWQQDYFLKVRSEPASRLSVLLPHYLHAQGMPHVVAPILTGAGTTWGTVERFTLILYPFIDGANAWNTGLTDAQWIALGEALKALHTTQLPPFLLADMPRESFIPHPKWMVIIKSLQATIGNRVYDSAFERQLAVFWQDHADEIGTIIAQTERLSHRLQQSAPDRVLCHADIHTANVLIDAQGQLFIVDWDEAILAPKERDLMFVTVGGFVTEERIESLFFQGYGKTQIDPLVMAYYRFERSMEDLAAFAERVFAADASDAVKQDSVEWFKRQFAPGGLIEAAYKQEHWPT